VVSQMTVLVMLVMYVLYHLSNWQLKWSVMFQVQKNIFLHSMWQKILSSRYFRTSFENLCCKTEKFEVCEKIYKNKNMLAFHKLTYGTTELYLCQYCERFVFSSSLGLHLIGDHKDMFQSLCNSCITVFLSWN